MYKSNYMYQILVSCASDSLKQEILATPTQRVKEAQVLSVALEEKQVWVIIAVHSSHTPHPNLYQYLKPIPIPICNDSPTCKHQPLVLTFNGVETFELCNTNT